MATNPLGQFLTNFASAYTGIGNLRGDPIREAAFGEDVRRYNEAAPQREANLRFVEAQADRMELANTQDRKKIAAQQFAEAELRVNELGGIKNALGDPVFKQRLISSVNALGEDAGAGMQITDYARLNRQNAQQWGLDPEQYEAMLMQHNPGHTPGEEDDEILVPLYKQRDGSVAPLDIDGDGTMDTWSAQEAVDMIRGQFVGSDEYARALGSLYTGQPGAGGGGGVRRSQPAAPAPEAQAQTAQRESTPPEREGEVEFLPFNPGDSEKVREGEKQLFTDIYTRKAAEAADVVPAAPNESDETALGVPKSELPEKPSRAARRVAEGKGISPAQAKSLAEDSSELPAPTPKATVAAGYNFLSDLEETTQGGGGGGYSSRGGNKPSHKQLTTAVILNRAGLLDSEALTRFADLGVVSSDGVSTIQTGMQQVGQTQRQAMANATSVQNTRIREAGALQRNRETIAARMALAEAKDAPTYADTLELNRLTAQTQLEASGMSPEMAEEQAGRIAAKTTQLGAQSKAFQRADWENPRLVSAVAELDAFDQYWNEGGPTREFDRFILGKDKELNLSNNPLAVLLRAEDSPIMDVGTEQGFWEGVVRRAPIVDDVFRSLESTPRFISVIQEPMLSAATQAGAVDMIENNPEVQMRIYDIATMRVRQRIAEEGRGVLNDDEAIKREVLDATSVYLEALKAGGY